MDPENGAQDVGNNRTKKNSDIQKEKGPTKI